MADTGLDGSLCFELGLHEMRSLMARGLFIASKVQLRLSVHIYA